MVSRYVTLYQCSECGRIYQEKQMQGCNNQFPTLPPECTFIKNFDLVRQGREEVKVCRNKRFSKAQTILVSGYRHYEELDEHSLYVKKQLLKKFGR